MRRAAAALAATLVCLLPGIEAQQTALTDAHLKSADLEIPKLVNVLGLKPGMAVADVGAGFGAWTMKLSKVVGPEGRVYANEIGTAQLGALRDSVQRDRLTNVTVVEGTATSVNLPAACCDAILIRDAYHHIAHPDAIVHSIAGALKPGGRLAVVDFPPRPHSAVPSDVPADRGGHGVLPEVVEREFGRVLVHVSTTLMWSPESQPASLYLVLFRKP